MTRAASRGAFAAALVAAMSGGACRLGNYAVCGAGQTATASGCVGGSDVPTVDDLVDATDVAPPDGDGAPDVPLIDAPLIDAPDAPAPPLGRPRAPMSGSRVVGRTVTLRFDALAEGGQVALCRDTACASIQRVSIAAGADFAPVSLPDDGVYFWRLESADHSSIGPTWWFRAESVALSGSATTGVTYGADYDGDADGRSDVLVGQPGFAPTVYRYPGLPTAAPSFSAPDHLVPMSSPPDGFGTSVASAGDVDGDGKSDIVAASATAVLAYLSSMPGDWVTIPFDTHGHALVAAAGDVDGDGYGDIAIAEPLSETLSIVRGGPTALGAPIPVTLPAAGITSLAGGCDVTGDGRPDVLAGLASQNTVFVVSHAGTPHVSSALHGGSATARFGASVACAGDFDGDGNADVAVGAPGDRRVFLLSHTAAGDLVVTRSIAGPAGADAFGSSVIAVGDYVSGAFQSAPDGRTDLLVVSAVDDPDAASPLVFTAAWYDGVTTQVHALSAPASTATTVPTSVVLAPVGDTGYAASGPRHWDVVIGDPAADMNSGAATIARFEPAAMDFRFTPLDSPFTAPVPKRFGASVALARPSLRAFPPLFAAALFAR